TDFRTTNLFAQRSYNSYCTSILAIPTADIYFVNEDKYPVSRHYGIGPDTAAEMLLAFGDNHNRVHSEAAFAKMCGVCPIPTSSGKIQRHRLNRGGNRQANAALFRVVIVRMRWHEPTKAYVARRTAQGLSKQEIIRCLKRYLAREIYQIIRKTLSTPKVIAP
ncbi:transposase, partial [Gloeocapsopsis sp. IPPAS B-1203]|uniref:transposase n=1 Tax=Gloeocapsopsis sp. IPPAS B-1203 TaxID=2049454 RepID=UPI0025A2F320